MPAVNLRVTVLILARVPLAWKGPRLLASFVRKVGALCYVVDDVAESDQKPFRILPAMTPENEHFWKGGAEEELRFQRCRDCQTYIHPPAPVCPGCLSAAIGVEAVSGRATLMTYTVNHHPWIPGFDPPYIIAIVEIVEQPGLRLTTNLVQCEESDLEIGMTLRVVFEDAGEGVFLPLFAPESD